MGEIVIALLVAIVIAAPFAVLLAKQGFPGVREGEAQESPENGGPTGEKYPPGSRAWPGAERMTDEPPFVEVKQDDDY